MVVLAYDDLFEVKVASLLAGYDRDTLCNLYQPLVGYSAVALYLTFWSESTNQKITSLSTHESLLSRMKMPTGLFVDSRKLLEAVGLLRTRLEKLSGTSIYHYELLAPKTPRDFFKDTLLYGLLIQALGEDEANKLKQVYARTIVEEEGEDITSDFNEVFHPDLDNGSFLRAATESTKFVGRNKAKIKTEFNYSTFFNELSLISQIDENDLTKKEMKEIDRICSLYGLSEKEGAYLVSNVFDTRLEKGSRVDLKEFNRQAMDSGNYSFMNKVNSKSINKVNADTALADKINLLETLAPKKYLSALQNGTKVAMSDLKIIQSLSEDFGLKNGVINVVIEFVLEKNNNILSKAYCEKIAASLVRSNIVTAIDAMNFCNHNVNKNSGATKVKPAPTKEKSDIVFTSQNNDGELTQDEWNSLLNKNKENKDEQDATCEDELPF